ncbi:MAG: type II secretion system F family protein [Verrucomicrobiae bacterium]|nr:type II secretion system F family protein [Verrucomicrobiae bacterium]
MPSFSPGRLQQKAESYRQLGSLIQAGVSILQAFRLISEHPPAAWVARQAREIQASLETGATLTEAFRQVHPPPPAFDLALIEAAEQGGRLAEVLRFLAEHYEMQAQIARSTLTDLLYPLFLLHFAAFIFPFAEFFTSGHLGRYLLKTLGFLLPLYAVVGGLVYAFLPTHSETWRAQLERGLRFIPLLGSARHKLALARLAAALHALLNAGVPIFRAWELAAAASGSPALRQAVGQWPPQLAAGRTPAELVQGQTCFPTLFANLYSSGEISGRLDEELRHLQHLYLEEGRQQMRIFWSWVPKVIYLLIALAIAFKVISFYTAHYGGVFREM